MVVSGVDCRRMSAVDITSAAANVDPKRIAVKPRMKVMDGGHGNLMLSAGACRRRNRTPRLIQP